MTYLDISLLGPLQVTRDGRPIGDLAYDKVRALLAYLAVEGDRPHRREALAALLWPDQPDEDARHGLRQALATLRQAIGDATATPPYLLITRDTVGLNRASDHRVDVTAFAELLDACDRHPHRRPETCAPCAERLEQAAALYRGDFLAGFSPSLSVEFEEWVLAQRERLRRRYLDALARLATYQEGRGAYDRAREVVERQLEGDPWRESAHRQLMRVLWLGGDRAAALAQYERCRRVLADELGVEPEAETTALCEDIRRSHPAAPSVVVRAAPPRAHNLPEPLTPLVGRARELEEIADRLADPACRLLTLVGPGGIGKTRLAMQAARDQATTFAQGVWFVPLAPVGSVALLAPTIAQALGVALRDRADPIEQLVNRLRGWEALLVLDNFEHLLAGATVISDVLERAPELKILATSRERLNLRGEWVFAVEGLDVPKGDATDAFEGYGAVQLFVQGLRRARLQAPLRAEERPSVVRICRLVEGMPLALELAAAWASVLSLPEIGQEVEQSLGFLATSQRDMPPQHRSVRAAFDHSWNLLSEDERAVFRRLSVFRGGFLRPAAAELAGASLPILSALVAKSFLRKSPGERYDIHELLRQYGAEKLATDPHEERQMHDRHCAYYLDFVAQREAALEGRGQRVALEEIDAEMGNVRAAWRWATTHVRAHEIVRATHALWLFYATRARTWEGVEAFGRAVVALEGGHGVADVPSAERALAAGEALVGLGGLQCWLGRYEDARETLDRAVALLRGRDAPRELGLALNVSAIVPHARGEYQEERALLQESLALFRAAGDDWGAAYSLNDLAMVAHLQGNDEEARRLAQESLALFGQRDDRRGQAFALHNLGVVAAGMGRYDEAAGRLRASFALRRATGDQRGIAASLIQLGAIARLTGLRHEAKTGLLDALRTALESGVLPIAVEALVELAALALDEGQPDRAHEILGVVVDHPACSRLSHDTAERLLAEGERQVAAGPSAGEPGVPPAPTVEELAHALLCQAAPGAGVAGG